MATADPPQPANRPTTDTLAAAARSAARKGPAPVHLWNPPFCGDLDMRIARDGTWFYLGTPIGRKPLVRLFASILKREGDRFYLVTPVEKLGIAVEDTPFLAVLMRREVAGAESRIVVTTNVGEEIVAGPDHPIRYVLRNGEWAPYIEVRAGLEALISRTVFYDLVAIGETREIDGKLWFGVSSAGAFFPFRPSDEIFADQA